MDDVVERLTYFRRRMVGQSEEPELHALLGDAIAEIERHRAQAAPSPPGASPPERQDVEPTDEVVTAVAEAIERTDGREPGRCEYWREAIAAIAAYRKATPPAPEPQAAREVIEKCAGIADGVSQERTGEWRASAGKVSARIRALAPQPTPGER